MCVGCKVAHRPTRARAFFYSFSSLFFSSFLSFPFLALPLLLIRADHLANTSGAEQQPPTRDRPTSNSTRPPRPRPLQVSDGAHPRPSWNASRPEPCARGASRTPSPARVCVRIYLQVSPYLHHTKGLQCGGCSFLLEVCSKSQFALTVKNLTRFQGFDLRIAVIGKFGF